MALGNAYPKRVLEPNLRTVSGVFTGAAAANMVKVTGKGITSLAYNAATGKFLLNFTDVGVEIRGWRIHVGANTGVAPPVGSLVLGSFSASAKTCQVEFWDMAAPSLSNPQSTMKVYVEVDFSDSTYASGG